MAADYTANLATYGEVTDDSGPVATSVELTGGGARLRVVNLDDTEVLWFSGPTHLNNLVDAVAEDPENHPVLPGHEVVVAANPAGSNVVSLIAESAGVPFVVDLLS